jgi:hypothetical protein
VVVILPLNTLENPWKYGVIGLKHPESASAIKIEYIFNFLKAKNMQLDEDEWITIVPAKCVLNTEFCAASRYYDAAFASVTSGVNQIINIRVGTVYEYAKTYKNHNLELIPWIENNIPLDDEYMYEYDDTDISYGINKIALLHINESINDPLPIPYELMPINKHEWSYMKLKFTDLDISFMLTFSKLYPLETIKITSYDPKYTWMSLKNINISAVDNLKSVIAFIYFSLLEYKDMGSCEFILCDSVSKM